MSLQEVATLPLAYRGSNSTQADGVWLARGEDTAAAAATEAIDPYDFSTLALH